MTAGRPSGSKNTRRSKHIERRNTVNSLAIVERDLWRGILSLGKRVSVMPLNVEYSCEFGTCRRTASHLNVFRTDSLRCCQVHQQTLERKLHEHGLT